MELNFSLVQGSWLPLGNSLSKPHDAWEAWLKLTEVVAPNFEIGKK
jgi:hypothetical protein